MCFSLQPGHHSSLTEPNLQPTANQDRNNQCGIQHHSRELLMMGIVVRDICLAYKKYNKITGDIYLVFYSSVIIMMHGPIKSGRNTCLDLDYLNIVSLHFKFTSFIFHRNIYEYMLLHCSKYNSLFPLDT